MIQTRAGLFQSALRRSRAFLASSLVLTEGSHRSLQAWLVLSLLVKGSNGRPNVVQGTERRLRAPWENVVCGVLPVGPREAAIRTHILP